MLITQVYDLVNTATREVLGESAILKEDLSNVVDIGSAVMNANAYDAYVKSLVNHIGKVIFVNRGYSGSAPSVLKDGWEYGSVLEKIAMKLPIASEDESWELENGVSYDSSIFYQPDVYTKFFNKKVTFEIDISILERQVKQSFSSATQLNGFISLIYATVEKSITVKLDALILRTITNFIGETIYDDFGSALLSGGSHVKAVNLLYLYNQKYGTQLTVANCLETPDFIRFACYIMGLYKERLATMSTLFNVGGMERFTPSDLLHCVLLADFEKSATVFLQSGTFNKDLVALPKHETVSFWQGSGTSYAFADVSKIDVKTASNVSVSTTGVLGVMFDNDALGVNNVDRRVTSHYSAKGEFWNNFYKNEAQYFNDLNENFVVFFVA